MAVRRPLTREEREEIAVGRAQGEGVREIARRVGRCSSVVSREPARNSSTRGYRASTADKRAATRRRRPQQRLLDDNVLLRQRVLADLRYGRTPNQIAGRLKLEAQDTSVAVMEGSLPAGGETISHEAVCTWIYAPPKGELARLGVMLPSRRTARGPRRRPDASQGAGSPACARSTTVPPKLSSAGSPAAGKATSSWAGTALPRPRPRPAAPPAS
ncbi:helix-turn-helix domain-containing protein [Streptomyces cathayae]|uniref:Helix-turn-helix domain-containing protein n=1 Tax=Streptomyces cathayae TaxID=3031124 RepID=A0ABY8JRW0_9ACTN|nr:helix-turn-helix domain-containing protein [Streptomyces sp. HUAS 5]WGD38730.1 helix-turn-helix domain-containing protein [Streptomyces sp. HUAS 5]WGD45236.1 helix-turn-helix domain-containing protein [Streptomyces sp. HUAS 5]